MTPLEKAAVDRYFISAEIDARVEGDGVVFRSDDIDNICDIQLMQALVACDLTIERAKRRSSHLALKAIEKVQRVAKFRDVTEIERKIRQILTPMIDESFVAKCIAAADDAATGN